MRRLVVGSKAETAAAEDDYEHHMLIESFIRAMLKSMRDQIRIQGGKHVYRQKVTIKFHWSAFPGDKRDPRKVHLLTSRGASKDLKPGVAGSASGDDTITLLVPRPPNTQDGAKFDPLTRAEQLITLFIQRSGNEGSLPSVFMGTIRHEASHILSYEDDKRNAQPGYKVVRRSLLRKNPKIPVSELTLSILKQLREGRGPVNPTDIDSVHYLTDGDENQARFADLVAQYVHWLDGRLVSLPDGWFIDDLVGTYSFIDADDAGLCVESFLKEADKTKSSKSLEAILFSKGIKDAKGRVVVAPKRTVEARRKRALARLAALHKLLLPEAKVRHRRTSR